MTTLSSILWKTRTAIRKRWINIQDRLGFYPYQAWIAENEKRDAELVEVSSFANRPLVCFLVPCDETRAQDLLASLDSLGEQSYPNWEARLALFSGSVTRLGDELAPLLQAGDRIRLVSGESSRVSDPIQAALRETSAEFVALLFPGDSLSPGMLYQTVEALIRAPEAEIVYFDEDHLAADRRSRYNPLFKPDWSPELLLSINFLYHAVLRRDLVDKAVSQAPVGQPIDFTDLVMRCAEQAQHIHHIPKVLYHRRGPNLHPRADNAITSAGQCRAVQAHLNRMGIPAEAHPERGNVRVTWPASGRKVSIIIPTRDHLGDLKKCVDSILTKTRYTPYELVLVDNSSHWEASRRYYREHLHAPNVSILRYEGEFNYSAALNLGAQSAQGDILIFLNNDTEVIDPGWLEELVRWVDRPEVGIAGAKLLYPSGAIQHAGVVIGMEGHASHVFSGAREGHSGPFGSTEWYRNYSAVTGACMAIRRELFERIGGFDEGYRLAFSDVEICQRVIRRGYRVVYSPYARLVHYEGKTRCKLIPVEDIERAYQHLKEIVQSGDPYFNPNLSYAARIPTFRRREEAPLARLENILKFSRPARLRSNQHTSR